jgi:hypothetical protein
MNLLPRKINGGDMWKKSLLMIVIIWGFISNFCWNTHAQRPDLKDIRIYDSDEVATYYYEPKGKMFLTEDIVRVWVLITAKHRNLGLPKQS